MATGLLILGVDSSTRLLTFLVGLDKEYTATIRLGQATTTDDAEGEVVASADPAKLSEATDAAIAAGILNLTGEIAQVPSSFSAIKVDGVRSYDRARAGEAVEAARPHGDGVVVRGDRHPPNRRRDRPRRAGRRVVGHLRSRARPRPRGGTRRRRASHGLTTYAGGTVRHRRRRPARRRPRGRPSAAGAGRGNAVPDNRIGCRRDPRPDAGQAGAGRGPRRARRRRTRSGRQTDRTRRRRAGHRPGARQLPDDRTRTEGATS